MLWPRLMGIAEFIIGRARSREPLLHPSCALTNAKRLRGDHVQTNLERRRIGCDAGTFTSDDDYLPAREYQHGTQIFEEGIR
jgi:hypothetical protein